MQAYQIKKLALKLCFFNFFDKIPTALAGKVVVIIVKETLENTLITAF